MHANAIAIRATNTTEERQVRLRKKRFSVRQAVFLGGVHVAALAALFFPSRAALAAALFGYVLSGLGISLGYHRLLSHGAFRAPRWLRRGLTLLGATALQGGPITWVGFHRAHHRFTEAEGDPHSATRGLFWSHMGWALYKGPNGYRRQKLRFLTAGIERDEFFCWLERNHLWINLALFVLVLSIFGFRFALWAFPLRIALLWHVTWSTNSVAHGALRSGPPAPCNVGWLALLGFGEGLHKNHHDAPSHACFAKNPGEIDPGFWALGQMERFGLVRLPDRTRRLNAQTVRTTS